MQIRINGHELQMVSMWINERAVLAVVQVERPVGTGWEQTYTANPIHEIERWDRVRVRSERRNARSGRRNTRRWQLRRALAGLLA